MNALTNKSHWRELAVHGGRAAFPEPLHVGRPNVGDRAALLRRIESALDRKWLTNNGPYVQELETRLAELCGVEHCVLVSNGTAALELAAAALRISPRETGGRRASRRSEVLMPSLTFVATAHAFRWRGCRPVFADVDPDTLTLDAAAALRRCTADTTAICGVHLFGQICDVDGLQRLADERGVPLIYDASHALSNSLPGELPGGERRVGQFGTLEVFSLHATKFIGCGEGGAIATRHGELAERLRRLRNFGFSDQGRVEQLGVNAKMSELAAAMGLSMLEQRERFVDANRRNYEAYRDALQGLPGIRLRPCHVPRQNCQYVVIHVDGRAAQLGRDELMRVLHAEGVLARPYFSPPCHRLPPYCVEDGSEHGDAALPVTERAAAELLALPTGESVTPEQIRLIGRLISLAQSRWARAA
ncbi:MAG: aminotransferase class I/II-fold pyridoxal phosphate-dependent enzyme [Planctomycetales bacterium]|nr:aminotransferase class I/II-fold pyridoxal phosphate-dependent enzyme [Planctomycetales bacterium]